MAPEYGEVLSSLERVVRSAIHHGCLTEDSPGDEWFTSLQEHLSALSAAQDVLSRHGRGPASRPLREDSATQEEKP